MAKGKIWRQCAVKRKLVAADQCKECPLDCKNLGGRENRWDRGGKDTTKGCKQF